MLFFRKLVSSFNGYVARVKTPFATAGDSLSPAVLPIKPVSTGPVSANLTGLAVGAAIGTLTPSISYDIAGQSVTAAQGSITGGLIVPNFANAGVTGSAADGTSYTTNPFTPANGDYLLVYVLGNSTAISGTLSDSQGLSWSLVSSITSNTTDKFSVFISTTQAQAVSMDVTWDCTGDPALGAAIGVARLSGTQGRVRQVASNTGISSVSPNLTFTNNCLNNNPVILCLVNQSSPHGTTPPTSYTALGGGGYLVPVTGMATSARKTETGNSMTWATASATDWAVMGVEVYGFAVYDAVLSGQGLSVSQGNLTTSYAVSLGGQGLTVGQGSLTAQAPAGSTLTGQALVASLGTLTPSISMSVSGQAATVSRGTLTAALSANISGQSVSIGQGSFSLSNQKALTGQAVTVSQGSTVAALSVSASGQSASVSQGSVTGAFAKALTGQAITVAQGSLTPAFSKALTGQALLVNSGSLISAYTVTLSGNSATVGQGSLSAQVPTGSTLSGQALATQIGTLTPSITKALSGQSVTLQSGSVTSAFALPLSGMAVTLQSGSVSSANFLNLAGFDITAGTGSVSVTRSSSLSGNQLTASIGSISAINGAFNTAFSGQEITVDYAIKTINCDLAQQTIITDYLKQNIKVDI